MQKEILNSNEAAQFLGISMSALYKLNFNKKITFFKPNKKLIYYRKSDLEAYMLSNCQNRQEDIENQFVNNLKLKSNEKK